MLINRNKLLIFLARKLQKILTDDVNATYGFGLTVGGESKSTLWFVSK